VAYAVPEVACAVFKRTKRNLKNYASAQNRWFITFAESVYTARPADCSFKMGKLSI
jgi:hypothetical protein